MIKKITIAEHRGGLKESLETEREISLIYYLSICDQYEYYAYDERIKAYRLLIKDLEHNYKLKRDWINIYIE